MDNVLTWLMLKSVPGIGNLIFKRLLDRFSSPASVFEAAPEDLMQIKGMNRRLASRILHYHIPDTVKKEYELARKNGYHIITLHDDVYPPMLREIEDPPPFLYVYGTLEKSIRNIAVVGARKASSYGMATARGLCKALTRNGLTIVSGMARGIDTVAHHGTLAAGGKTIAVLGSGLQRIYPMENRRLFHEIAQNGAVISELPLNADPEAHHFPARNRIISGMSLGTVVIEAAPKSGSLITARLAAEQNREVFAVPGSIHSVKSSGTHNLIKQGAKLVETARDILEELTHFIDIDSENAERPVENAAHPSANLTSEETRVIQCLEAYPAHIDKIQRALSLPPGKLQSILLQLELKGTVQQSEGNYYSILPKD